MANGSSDQDSTTFTRGEVVWLNSSNQRMTVYSIEPNGEVVCVWIVNGVERDEQFPPQLLTKNNPDGFWKRLIRVFSPNYF